MSTPIKITAYVACATTGGNVSLGITGELTMEGVNYVADNQDVGTSAELLTVGDIASANALCLIKNTDPTNFVTLYQDGASGAQVLGKLLPGQFALLWTSATPNIGAKADTATCRVSKRFFENVSIASLLTQPTPTFPALGKSRQYVRVDTTIDNDALGFTWTNDQTIASASIIAAATIGETNELAFPNILDGVAGYGVFAGFNYDSAAITTLGVSDPDSYDFANLPVNGGFIILPLNGTNMIYELTGTAHAEGRLATKLPAA